MITLPVIVLSIGIGNGPDSPTGKDGPNSPTVKVVAGVSPCAVKYVTFFVGSRF